MFRLVIEDDEGRVTVIPLTRDEVTLGRHEDCPVRFIDPTISRRHACLRVRQDAVSIEDLGSRNGLEINGQPCSGEVVLQPGDLVSLGFYRLQIERHERLAEQPREEAALAVEEPPRAARKVWAVGAAGVATAAALVAVVGLLGDWSSVLEPVAAPVVPPVERPSAAEELVRRADEAFAAGRWEDAVQLSQAALKLPDPPARAAGLLEQAQAMYRGSRALAQLQEAYGAQQWDRAAELVATIPADGPFAEQAKPYADALEKAVGAHLATARGALKDRRFEEVRRELDAALALAPDSQAALQLEHRLDRVRSRAERAPQRTAVRTGPVAATRNGLTAADLAEARRIYRRGTEWLIQGKFDRAIEQYQRALRVNPHYAEVYRSLGIAYAKLDDGAHAVESYRQYVELAPQAPDVEQVLKIIADYEQR